MRSATLSAAIGARTAPWAALMLLRQAFLNAASHLYARAARVAWRHEHGQRSPLYRNLLGHGEAAICTHAASRLLSLVATGEPVPEALR